MTRARIFRLAVSLALASLAVGLGGLSVYRKVQSFQPLGFTASPLVDGIGMVIEKVDAPSSGLRPGDQILVIEEGAASLAERLREQPVTTLQVLRGDEVANVRYQRPPLQPDIPYLILALIGAVYLCVGLFTVLRHGGGQSFLFYLWCLVSAGLYLLSPILLSPIGATDLAYRAIYLFDAVCRLLLPALTVHLFLVFPSRVEAAGWARRIIPFLYLPAAALLTLQADLVLANGHWVFGRPTAERLQALDRLELIHFAVLSVAALMLLLWRFRSGAAWDQRRQMQWMTYGVTAGYLPFLLLYGLPRVLGLDTSQWVTSLAVVPLGLVPLAFAYAILRYKLWDIEVIVRDTISATLTLLLGIIGFSLVNLAINRGVSEELSFARNLLSFASGLGIAALLVPTRGAISSALGRLQYGDTFGKRQALAGLGRELLLERDLGRLCGGLLGRIEEAVSLETTNLYLQQRDSLRLVRHEEELPGTLSPDAFGEGFWEREVERLSGVALPAGELSVPTRLFVAGYRYAFPILVRGRGIGVALTSFKREHTPLNSEDTELIRHLLNQAALAIENAQLLGQLQIQLEEVQQLQRYTEGIFESSPAGIAVLDGERLLLSVNSAFAAVAGRERQELLGQSLESVLPVQPLPAPGETPVEVSWCDAGGRERYLQLSLASFERGWRDGLSVLVVHDVSDRVAMENAMREQDRLAALGMLAAGVAHEVNTPITGISSYAQMLLQDTPPGDPHYEILKKVERQTFRAARIVNNLLEFARNRQKERKPVVLAPLVTECVDLLGERLGKRRIELEWTPPEDKVLVMGCDGELQQVFTNLILNALDAMGETGGRLRLGIEADGAKAVVRVQDSGPGIPPEKLEKIFQPFYSTKLNRGGTGLGLSISFEIVRRHGGDLRVVSSPGEGACFLVELPRHDPAALA